MDEDVDNTAVNRTGDDNNVDAFDDKGTTYNTPDVDENEPDRSTPVTKAYALAESKPTNATRNTDAGNTDPDRTSDANTDSDKSDNTPHQLTDDDDNTSNRDDDEPLDTNVNGANDHANDPAPDTEQNALKLNSIIGHEDALHSEDTDDEQTCVLHSVVIRDNTAHATPLPDAFTNTARVSGNKPPPHVAVQAPLAIQSPTEQFTSNSTGDKTDLFSVVFDIKPLEAFDTFDTFDANSSDTFATVSFTTDAFATVSFADDTFADDVPFANPSAAHGSVLHGVDKRDRSVSDGHATPLPDAFTNTARVSGNKPPPHVAVQAPLATQSDTTQSTSAGHVEPSGCNADAISNNDDTTIDIFGTPYNDIPDNDVAFTRANAKRTPMSSNTNTSAGNNANATPPDTDAHKQPDEDDPRTRTRTLTPDAFHDGTKSYVSAWTTLAIIVPDNADAPSDAGEGNTPLTGTEAPTGTNTAELPCTPPNDTSTNNTTLRYTSPHNTDPVPTYETRDDDVNTTEPRTRNDTRIDPGTNDEPFTDTPNKGDDAHTAVASTPNTCPK